LSIDFPRPAHETRSFAVRALTKSIDHYSLRRIGRWQRHSVDDSPLPPGVRIVALCRGTVGSPLRIDAPAFA
jgi:hypothetical protein